jgi:hypothetical protein
MISEGLGWVASALGVVIVLGVLALINGGFVYRTECPRVAGSVETEWTWRIFSVVPYIGYSRSGCETHTATRVALDALGIWKLDRNRALTADHRREYAPDNLTAMKNQCVANGESMSFCDCAMDELARRFTPSELSQITAVTQLDSLPSDLGHRASDAFKTVERDC